MLQFLSQYFSFWITVFYLILELLKNLGFIKYTNTIYLAIYSLMFIVVTFGTLLITINGEKIRKNVNSPFKPNQMLLLHLVLLVYVVLNNPFLKIELNAASACKKKLFENFSKTFTFSLKDAASFFLNLLLPVLGLHFENINSCS